MKKFLAFLALAVAFSACLTKTNPNQYVVVTNTCWNSMWVVKAGQMVPRLYTACDRKIILPAYAMDGVVNVPARFKGDVKGGVIFEYQYEIRDAVAFVQSAKFITSADTNEDGKVNDAQLEQAENSAIDKIVKDVAREYLQNVEAINVDESKIENDIRAAANQRLQERGVQLLTTSVKIDFNDQTEEAIDVVSALNLYKAAGAGPLGEEVIKQRAGKPAINVSVEAPAQKADD